MRYFQDFNIVDLSNLNNFHSKLWIASASGYSVKITSMKRKIELSETHFLQSVN